MKKRIKCLLLNNFERVSKGEMSSFIRGPEGQFVKISKSFEPILLSLNQSRALPHPGGRLDEFAARKNLEC